MNIYLCTGLIHIVPKQRVSPSALQCCLVCISFTVHINSTEPTGQQWGKGRKKGRKAASSSSPNPAQGPLDQATLPAAPCPLSRKGPQPSGGKAACHSLAECQELSGWRSWSNRKCQRQMLGKGTGHGPQRGFCWARMLQQLPHTL